MKIEPFAGSLKEEVCVCSIKHYPIATLNFDNGVAVNLCEGALRELQEAIVAFNERVCCYQCKHFLPSKHGFAESGTCILLAQEKGKTIQAEDIGAWCYNVDPLGFCNKAEKRSVESVKE